MEDRSMRMEHVALNVADPVAMATWYVEHLGMRIVRQAAEPTFVRFLEATDGSGLVEIYRNEAAPVPDYARMHPLELHLAFSSADVDADCQRLLRAGATLFEAPLTTGAGDRLAMLRDPWHVAIQLTWRKQPMRG